LIALRPNVETHQKASIFAHSAETKIEPLIKLNQPLRQYQPLPRGCHPERAFCAKDLNCKSIAIASSKTILIHSRRQGIHTQLPDVLIHASHKLALLAAFDVSLQHGVGFRESRLQAEQFPSRGFAVFMRLAHSFAALVPLIQGTLAFLQELLVLLTQKSF